MTTPPTPSRRAIILGGLAGAGGLALGPWHLPARADTSAGPLPLLEPVDPASVRRAEFAPEEQRLASYLVTLAAMANDVDDSDTPMRGFMAGGWWRTPAEPFNARISEHVFTFSWFLANRRSWNPYFRDAALQARLDAAIGYYLRLQHPDGSWPEYSPDERSRAATAFALGYLSKTLAHLREIDVLPGRRTEITAALRRGMEWFLDPGNTEIWQPDIVEFSNQPLAGLAGAAKALALDPDRRLEAMLWDRIDHTVERVQSPAGFLYEPRGMDIAYNLNVTLTEIHELHTELRVPVFLKVVRRLADWFGYVMVPEPDGSGLIAFASGAARTPMYYLDDVTVDRQQRDLGSVFTRQVPAMRPFYTSAEDRAAARGEWAASSEPVPVLAPGDTNPRIPANIPYGENYPRRRHKDIATAQLPTVKKSHFTELRSDPLDQHYLFVRRPALYVQAFFGTRPNTVVRAGFGLLWHPRAGVFVHGGQNSNETCWATVLPNGGTDGASNLTPTFFDGPVDDGRELMPRQVARAGDLGIHWSTTGGNVTGRALITDASVVREIATTMDGVEQVPLVLMPDDDVRWSDGTPVSHGEPSEAAATGLTVVRDGVTLDIDWGQVQPASVTPTDRTYFHDGRRRAHMLRVPHQLHGLITYTLSE